LIGAALVLTQKCTAIIASYQANAAALEVEHYALRRVCLSVCLSHTVF